MTVGVLAVQGAFIEHEKMLEKLGVDCFEIRKASDLDRSFDGLILPGGESTVMGKLLHSLNLFEPLKEKIQHGMPVLATCAGLILLAEQLTDDTTVHFGTMPVTVKRNAYGRQLGSFYTEHNFKDLGKIPMTFIRAPYIDKVSPETEVLATVDGNIVAARYKNQLGISFHPELDESTAVHELFLTMVKSASCN
jgi:5'-phosphate synthase pdxT subunit